jgi:hypothetical protein
MTNKQEIKKKLGKKVNNNPLKLGRSNAIKRFIKWKNKKNIATADIIIDYLYNLITYIDRDRNNLLSVLNILNMEIQNAIQAGVIGDSIESFRNRSNEINASIEE